jgi:four helix bundle protein
LIAWQRADDLYVFLHALTKTFPPQERYELSAQLRRAAYSVPANIVEGFARTRGRDRLQFLRIAWGSLAEVGYCIHVAERLGYLDDEKYAACDLQIRKVGAPLIGLLRAELKWLRSINVSLS